MELKMSDKVVGKIYCNVQLSKEALGMSVSDFLDNLKDKKITVELNGTPLMISGFRRTYQDEKTIYLEGTELLSK